MAGKPWYTNGIDDEIQCGPNDIIPDNYYKGRLPRSEESKQKLSLSLKGHPGYWTGKQMPPDSRGETLHLLYASGERVIWNKGLKNDPRCKGHELGTPSWNKGLTAETDERVAKYLSGWKDGTNLLKSNETKRKNNSFNLSLPEEKYYKDLINKYGEDDIIRQYSDSRYPFACDFYIISEDKFIELNKHWTHGGHPFDELNLDDISKLEEWEEKAKTSQFFKNAIYTWTDLDVRKLKIAKENNLNYETIY